MAALAWEIHPARKAGQTSGYRCEQKTERDAEKETESHENLTEGWMYRCGNRKLGIDSASINGANEAELA
jgi:hypothetical protein